MLKNLHKKNVTSKSLHRKLYPTCDQPPRFYRLPKIHKDNLSLHPIVSSIGSITYTCAQYLSTILSPLVGNTNSAAFVTEIQQLIIQPDEEMQSYDVSASFISVPVEGAWKWSGISWRTTSDSKNELR